MLGEIWDLNWEEFKEENSQLIKEDIAIRVLHFVSKSWLKVDIGKNAEINNLKRTARHNIRRSWKTAEDSDNQFGESLSDSNLVVFIGIHMMGRDGPRWVIHGYGAQVYRRPHDHVQHAVRSHGHASPWQYGSADRMLDRVSAVHAIDYMTATKAPSHVAPRLLGHPTPSQPPSKQGEKGSGEASSGSANPVRHQQEDSAWASSDSSLPARHWRVGREPGPRQRKHAPSIPPAITTATLD
ncbi:hypothetical protein KSP40_PGU008342 [Platanthera guangdongensis]|uniref:Uncharacterized protein n=1 Tax=Platanthera guangdongensis TaxID=2320717 RepID=A0ABR2M0U9_9ASPA